MTAVPTSPDGTNGPFITLVAMDMPDDGEWTVTFTSTDPAAELGP